MKCLCPIKPKKFKGKVFGFDIETANKNKDFVCASLYSDDTTPVYRNVFYQKKHLFEELKSKKFRNSFIVASNLSFDFFGTFFGNEMSNKFKWCFRGSDMVFAKTYLINGEFSAKSSITVKGKKVNSKHCITFIDTFSYAHYSVEKLGEILGVKKLDTPKFIGKMPISPEQWIEMVTYNMRDSEISYKFLKFLFGVFEDLGCEPKYTIASTSMNLFRCRFLKDKYYVHDKETLFKIYKAYYGGRTEAFKRGKIKDYKIYDINSLYPYVMSKFRYPDPNSIRFSKANTEKFIDKYEGFTHVKVRCPEMEYPLLPYRNNNKLLFPVGEFTGWYSNVELRKAKELGYEILEVYENIYYTRTIKIFEDFVNELYFLRKKYKEEGNPMELVVKLLLNSLYGKFAQRFTDRDNWIHKDVVTFKDIESSDVIERVGDFFRLKKDFDLPALFCIPEWSAYVTAYGRLELYDYIVKNKAIYCDTDSVMIKGDIVESSKIGGMKLELDIEKGWIVKPKFYCIRSKDGDDKVKIKGVAKRLTFGEFGNFIEYSPNEFTVTYNKFMKFKESVRRGFLPNEIVKIGKCLKLNDDKRIWTRNFNSGYLQDSRAVKIIEGLSELDFYEQNRKAMDNFYGERERMYEELDKSSNAFDGKEFEDSYDDFIENEILDIHDL